MTAFAEAVQHYERGELTKALPLFQRALHEQPGDVQVIYRAALTLVSMGDYQGCATWLQEIIPHINVTETPNWMMAGFYYNLGVAYEAQGKWAQGERAHRNALAFDPNAILPKIEVGTNCYRQGNPDEGKLWHDKALEPETVDIESRPARSFLKLLRGDYLGGFAEYESRWKMPQVLSKSYVPKNCWRWKGKPLNGKRILVVGEQGIGDTVLMSRYVPLIEERGGKVVLVVNPTLVRLFQHNFPNAQVIASGTPHPVCEWWVPMMSLPYVFQTTKATMPQHRLATLITPAVGWIVGSLGGKRVGFVTRGNPLFMGDRDRSAPDGAFAPLMQIPEIDWIDLSEKADRARDCRDMADTGSIIAQLDLVITVDTAIGHLAGALGVPCWLLPMTSLHWLWGMPEQTKSEWYPHHKLYRRTSVDAWPEVIERVKSDLLKLVGK